MRHDVCAAAVNRNPIICADNGTTRCAFERAVRAQGLISAVRLTAVGLDVVVEDSSSHGRLDMAVRFNDNVYLFEFKVVELAPEGAAIAQLKAKSYADKYRDRGEPIHLIGGGVQQGGPQPGGVRRRVGLTRRSDATTSPTGSSSSRSLRRRKQMRQL